MSKLQVYFIFIEIGQNTVRWFSIKSTDIPMTFAELNNSQGARAAHPSVFNPINGDPVEWQRLRYMEGVRFMTIVGYE